MPELSPFLSLSHLLIFDEAQAQIWSKHLEMRDRQSYMATLATQVRAFGMGIVVLAQNPALKLMSEIIANSCVKICFHLGSGNEIVAMARHMGLTQEQMETLYHLERGQAICRTGLGYTEPVLLEIYPFEDKPVSDAELTGTCVSFLLNVTMVIITYWLSIVNLKCIKIVGLLT